MLLFELDVAMLPVDLKEFIETVGYIGIFAIIFAETGLLIGFFCPVTACFSLPAFWHPRTSSISGF